MERYYCEHCCTIVDEPSACPICGEMVDQPIRFDVQYQENQAARDI